MRSEFVHYVTDQHGRAIVGANVQAFEPDTDNIVSLWADENGNRMLPTPTTTDSEGVVRFWVDCPREGRVIDVRFVGPGCEVREHFLMQLHQSNPDPVIVGEFPIVCSICGAIIEREAKPHRRSVATEKDRVGKPPDWKVEGYTATTYVWHWWCPADWRHPHGPRMRG